MAFEDEQCHLDMYDPSLKERVRKLRALAVKTLTENPNRTLHLEGDSNIITSELVDAVSHDAAGRASASASGSSSSSSSLARARALTLVRALRPPHVRRPPSSTA